MPHFYTSFSAKEPYRVAKEAYDVVKEPYDLVKEPNDVLDESYDVLPGRLTGCLIFTRRFPQKSHMML